MSDPILTVDGIGKRYASYSSNWQRFGNWFGMDFTPATEHWANRDISFSIRPGECLALIGQNGAGKSTLLKMITGVVRPTVGSIALAGRVNAILELGLGFNPEFTGRENIRHSGGLIGYAPDTLQALMPSIEAFAEIGDFFDEPVRIYSSGMQARIAFALATATPPDVLIIDEILSVGDSYFQHKSFDRIRQFKDQGTSIILVSHSMGDVRSLSDRVILLGDGRVLRDGPPDEVIDYYNALIAAKENAQLNVEQRRNKDGWSYTRSGTHEVAVEEMRLVDAESGEDIKVSRVGQALKLKIRARAEEAIPQLVLGVMIRDRSGHVIWGSNTWHTRQSIENVAAGQSVDLSLCFRATLGPGSYSLSPALVNSDTHLDKNFDWQDNAIVFDVINTDQDFFIGSNSIEYKFVIDP